MLTRLIDVKLLPPKQILTAIDSITGILGAVKNLGDFVDPDAFRVLHAGEPGADDTVPASQDSQQPGLPRVHALRLRKRKRATFMAEQGYDESMVWCCDSTASADNQCCVTHAHEAKKARTQSGDDIKSEEPAGPSPVYDY
jgi:hypothetical protein